MSLSLSQLATHAAKALQQADGRAVAYAWPHGWSGADTISVDGRMVPLHHCESPLALREALSSSDGGSRVLLVSIPENRVGQDVLGRLFRHRLLHVDRWQLIQDAFDVAQIDPRLFGLPWMPEMLLASVPSRRSSTAAVLTYEEAIESCLRTSSVHKSHRRTPRFADVYAGSRRWLRDQFSSKSHPWDSADCSKSKASFSA